LIVRLNQLRGTDEYLQSERFVGVSERAGESKAWGARQTPPEILTILIALEAMEAGRGGSPFVTRMIKALHPSGVIEERTPYRGGTLTKEKPHPDVNMRDLDIQIGKLIEHAENVARLVRGRERIRKGPSTGEISPRDHSVIRWVKQQTKEGISNEQIREEVNERFDRGPLGIEKDFTLEEIQWLRALPFENPS
jgi:hypothetical protein